MKIAVTAANGQLGSSIVNELKKEIGEKNVIGIVRSPEKASHLGVEIRKGDYNNRDDFNAALKGVDRVMLIQDVHNNKIYNLVGEPISQKELAALINQAYNTQLVFNPISVDDYAKERKQELGEFIGGVITGIYKGINDGVYDIPSDYEKAAGRPYKLAIEMIREYNNK